MKDDKSIIDISFETKKQSLLFFHQTIQLCYADGDYCDKERAEIDKMSKELGVSKNDIDPIEEWVLQGKAWVEAGESLMLRLCA